MAASLNGSSILVLVRTASASYAGELFGTGDGTTTTFSHTMQNPPVLPGSLTVTAGSVTATDNGQGTLTGTGVSSGSINYSTGAATITYSTAPASGTAITANYSKGATITAESIGAAGSTTYSHTMASIPVLLNSVAILVGGSVVANDDGLGNLVGSGVTSGSIDYDTGDLTITFSTPTGGAVTTNYTLGVYAAVGAQRDATFDEKTHAVDVSSKEAREKQYLPGEYSATVTANNLYVPSDTAFLALKNAMRNGTKVVIARQESGTEVEHASALITQMQGSFKDQTEAVISLTLSVDGPWIVS